jgi:aryl-alcohol dehydrogenase-like predicted oxidoreductase
MARWDEPDQLRAGIEENLAALGVEQLTAVNLRLLDNAVPDARFIDQLGAMVKAREDGLIAGIGISNVSLAHLLRAVEVTDIVCVQNSYSVADRSSEPLLAECMRVGGSTRRNPVEPDRYRDRRPPRRPPRPSRLGVATGHRP